MASGSGWPAPVGLDHGEQILRHLGPSSGSGGALPAGSPLIRSETRRIDRSAKKFSAGDRSLRLPHQHPDRQLIVSRPGLELTSNPKPRRNRTFAQLHDGGRGERAVGVAAHQDRASTAAASPRRRDVGRTRGAAATSAARPVGRRRSARWCRERRATGPMPGRELAPQGRRHVVRRAERARRRFPDGDGGDVVGHQALFVATPRCAPSSWCSRVSRCIRPSSGRPSESSGSRPARWSGGGDPGDVALLGEPDVGCLLVRIVDPLGWSGRRWGHPPIRPPGAEMAISADRLRPCRARHRPLIPRAPAS